MSSDDTVSESKYERVFKLWISLWNLILEDKRSLEYITASLQRYVFEHNRDSRKYKNWSKIAMDLPTYKRFTALAIATLDLDANTRDADCYRAAFPEYFLERDLGDQIPLSVIQQKGEELGIEDGSPNGREYPVSFGAQAFLGIPVQGFDKYGRNQASIRENGGLLLPLSIDPDCPQGNIVVWEGKDFVVLENNESCEEIWVAPLERVNPSL